MNKYISLTKIWEDDDIAEFRIVSSDGESTVSVKVYVGRENLKAMVPALERFKTHIHGGIYDLKFGEFGPEYANGTYLARLHFYPPGRGRLCITIHTESEWYEFGMLKDVADRTTLRLRAELGKFDHFVAQFTRLAEGVTDRAALECESSRHL